VYISPQIIPIIIVDEGYGQDILTGLGLDVQFGLTEKLSVKEKL